MTLNPLVPRSHLAVPHWPAPMTPRSLTLSIDRHMSNKKAISAGYPDPPNRRQPAKSPSITTSTHLRTCSRCRLTCRRGTKPHGLGHPGPSQRLLQQINKKQVETCFRGNGLLRVRPRNAHERGTKQIILRGVNMCYRHPFSLGRIAKRQTRTCVVDLCRQYLHGGTWNVG